MNTTAIINIAKQQLGLDEETYRALLVRVTGESSLRAMTERQRIDVVEEMKRRGFRVRSGGKALPVSTKPYVRMIHALWKSCHRRGVISDGSRKALRSFVSARSPKDDPDFLTYEEASPIIEALKVMEARGQEAGSAKGENREGRR
ncbi:regulatory protein GemA [Martelella lutilitoris]|uniref:Regulatory protein GemA n=1 Tax=Martelella lutilitoris TaxID=2583532 RepID=A0A7T7HH58_9HYPH|nr:regulatory protein GemA [Martelella lutilitoris]QQM29067.1 regulatory protein GemA [Martelella lutilitoris]